jgi:hypothetical protein
MMKANAARAPAVVESGVLANRAPDTTHQRLRHARLSPHVRDPLVVRPARRPAPELATNEPLSAKDGLRISFYGAFRQLLERSRIPLHTLVRTTCYSVYNWYYHPDKPPTSKSAPLVREVETVLGAPRGVLVLRLPAPAQPQARAFKRAKGFTAARSATKGAGTAR